MLGFEPKQLVLFSVEPSLQPSSKKLVRVRVRVIPGDASSVTPPTRKPSPEVRQPLEVPSSADRHCQVCCTEDGGLRFCLITWSGGLVLVSVSRSILPLPEFTHSPLRDTLLR